MNEYLYILILIVAILVFAKYKVPDLTPENVLILLYGNYGPPARIILGVIIAAICFYFLSEANHQDIIKNLLWSILVGVIVGLLYPGLRPRK